jgi:nucleoid-associated protein YgaU
MAPDAAASLDGRLADLGRRIDEARTESEARSSGRPFPKLLLAAVVLVVAIVAGGLALAARDGGGGADVAVERTPVTVAAAPVQAPAQASEAQAPVADEPAAQVAAPAPVPAGPEARTVTVARGESFWSIAEREVAAQLGRAPTDAEVTSWWASFVAANTDRLVNPGNPNLVVTGQVLVLPGGA